MLISAAATRQAPVWGHFAHSAVIGSKNKIASHKASQRRLRRAASQRHTDGDQQNDQCMKADILAAFVVLLGSRSGAR
jgi:hypothetical protein